MKKLVAAILAGFVALLSACGPVSSLNPLFTDSDVVFDSALLGDWTGGDSDNFTLRFEKDGSNGYLVVDTEFDGQGGASKETTFRAHLVNLDGNRFLDVVPDITSGQVGSYRMSVAPRRPDLAGELDGGELVRLDDGFYAEVMAGSSSKAGLNISLRQAHWIFRIQNDGGTLRLAGLDDEWLKKAIEQSQVSLSHSVTTDTNHDLIITASTDELQQLVREHAADQKAFQLTTELHRVN